MGHAIERLATSRGHEIVATIDNPEQWEAAKELLGECQVAIEFSTPQTAVDNIRRCFDIHLPIVCGTTGWNDQLPSLREKCIAEGQSLFASSNFSIGMNVVFALNRKLAALMNSLPDYEVSIDETHHIHKLDAPSGTAITLANAIIQNLDRKNQWALTAEDTSAKGDTIAVHSHRIGENPGEHTICYQGPFDTITLSHQAKSRDGLALGAILAAEYLVKHPGFATMEEMLGM